MASPKELPRDALGLGLRIPHYEYLFEHWPDVGYFEIISENFLGTALPPRRNLERVRGRYPIVLHGVGLNLLGQAPLDEDYLDKLCALADHVDAPFVTDHLCWTGKPPTEPVPRPSSLLASAALAGLLGLGAAAACSNDAKPSADSFDDSKNKDSGTKPPLSEAGREDSGRTSDASGDSGTFTRVLSTTPLTFEAFSDMCGERGGFVTTSANCAGSNLCRGLSYMTDGTVLSEHSCQGLSNCAGMSCVYTPLDSGLTGKEIYESGPCGGCHNTSGDPTVNTYTVFVHPGTDPQAALDEFKQSSPLRLASIVAFGTQGINANGTAFSNMPSYRKKYSRAEIERVVEYVQGLGTETEVYSIAGQASDAGTPSGTHHGMDGGP